MADAKLSLFANKTTTGAGTAVHIHVPANKENVPVAIRGITTGTILIEGSLDGTNYGTLLSKTADFSGVVPAFPYMRANASVATSIAAYVDLWADSVFGG